MLGYHVILYTDRGEEKYEVADIRFEEHIIAMKTSADLEEPDIMFAKRFVSEVKVSFKYPREEGE